MKKLALFFGAGAECSYGLPSGGKFALDIFRMDTGKDKECLKYQLNQVESQSTYAKWLQDDYQSRKLTAFTKGQYDTIVKGSLENKRVVILDYLKNFDDNVSNIVFQLEQQEKDIDSDFKALLKQDIGTFNFGKDIKLNKFFDEDVNRLFSSDYFSGFLKAIQIDDVDSHFKKSIRNITRAILELLIGDIGEELMHRLNDGIFDKSPDSIDLFDDLGAVFTLDYRNTGMRGLELLIDYEGKELNTIEGHIIEFGLLILENIYSRALDYQTLIDSNWRYIYNPQTDWENLVK